MKKRILSTLLVLCLCLTLLPTAALAADPVKYLDEDGNEQTCTDYTLITTGDGTTQWKDGWYVIQGEVTIDKGKVMQNVHLILCDNATLTVKYTAASGLTIYAQSTGANMGKFVTGDYNMSSTNSVGIQGAGLLTINGGDITASNNTGISIPELTVNGGKVTVLGGESGIHSDNITLNNGEITVKGLSDTMKPLYGIRANKSLKVNGGKITVVGSNKADIVLSALTVTAGEIDGYVSVSAEKASLSGGTFSKIFVSSGKLADVLDEGYVFKDSTSDSLYAKSDLGGNSITNVQVVKCKHSLGFGSDDRCLGCNLLCVHSAPGADGRCAGCKQLLVAKRTHESADTYFTTFSAALNVAESGDTLTLLAKDIPGAEIKSSITLDLNGKNIAGTLSVANAADITITDSATGGSVETLSIPASLSDPTAVNIAGGHIKTFRVSSSSAHVSLSGGTYDTIEVISTFSQRPLASLLSSGYVYKLANGSLAYSPTGTDASGVTRLTSVSVVEHKQCDFATFDSESDQFFCACGRTNAQKTVWYQAYNTTTGEFEKKTCNEYAQMRDGGDVSMNPASAWVVVEGDKTVRDSLSFGTAVNLILCDGATLTVNGGLSAKNLTIYGQEKGTGKLVVTKSSVNSDDWCNAINMDGKDLTVHGGNITATAAADTARNSCGIAADSMTVYGGTVSGNGGNAGNYSEGIHTGSTMTVVGGTVTGTGGTAETAGGMSYGIYPHNVLTVSGGTVKATGGDAGNYSYGIYVISMTVSGGTVMVATGKEGRLRGMDANSLTVSGGTLKLTEGSSMTKLTVSGSVTLADLLADGCAYRKWDEDEPSKLADLTSPLGSVKIVTHDHEYGEDGKCVYCGVSKPSDSSYSIKVLAAENGAVKASAKKAGKGKTIALTVTPDEGYELDEILVQDAKGNELELTEAGEGKFTFVMPRGAVTVEATFVSSEVEPEPEPDSPSFSDVPSDSWFAPAVSWAVKNGITTGTSSTTFAPDLPCTRAELVTFLWRAAGSPEPNGAAPFDDVPANAYYTAAVAWGFENDLVKGCGNNLFCPDNVISRQETVTLLYRYVAAGLTLPSAPPSTPLSPSTFEDTEEIGNWAQEAVIWAVNSGILQGFANKIMPNAPCSRSEIVTMLFRLLAK